MYILHKEHVQVSEVDVTCNCNVNNSKGDETGFGSDDSGGCGG